MQLHTELIMIISTVPVDHLDRSFWSSVPLLPSSVFRSNRARAASRAFSLRSVKSSVRAELPLPLPMTPRSRPPTPRLSPELLDDPRVVPLPVKVATLALPPPPVLRRPGVTENPLLVLDCRFGSPTGACSNSFRGSKHEQQTPKSANRFTCPGRVRPKSRQTKALAK